MSEKEILARRATSALLVEVPFSIAEDVHKKVSDALYEKHEHIHSLRLAVLDHYNVFDPLNVSGHESLAESANIEFKQGQWALKESE